MKKTFIYQDEKSDKFWTIETNGAGFTVTYGKTGTAGQTSSKSFDNDEKCLKEAEKLIAEKVKKGYVEEGNDESVLKPSHPKVKYYQNEFALNLVYQCKTNLKLRETRITKYNNGKLNLPTGKIIATDPLTCYDIAPFRVTVAPGSYPCSIYMEGDDAVALAALFFTGKPAIRWEMALIGQEKLSDIKTDGEFYGIGVDAGTASFMDLKTFKIVENMEGEGLFGVIDGEDFVNYTLEEEDFEGETKKKFIPNLNVVMYKSGSGDDGMYPSYFGYDEDGNTCCLVTDFMLIDEDDKIDWDSPVLPTEEELVSKADILQLGETDLSILDDDSPKPFFYFGAETGTSEVDYNLTIKFESAPTKELKAQILKSASEQLNADKIDMRDSALAISNSKRQGIQLAKWLLQIHTFSPVYFAVQWQKGNLESPFAKWHYTSLKTEKLQAIMQKLYYGYRESDKEDRLLCPLRDTIADHAEKYLNDETLLKIYPTHFGEKFMKDKIKAASIKEFIVKYKEDKQLIEDVFCGIENALDKKKLNEDDVYDVIRLLAIPIDKIKGLASLQYKGYWFGKTITKAIERKDTEFVNAMKRIR